MKFSTVAVAAAAFAGVQASSNITYTTKVVSSLVTYCPLPTKITHGGTTYTVTSATTLTITDCPCTITAPVTTSTAYGVPSSAPTAAPAPPATNGTMTYTSVKPAPPPPTHSANGSVPSITSVLPGSASRATAAGGFAAALLGLVAYAL